MKYLIIACLSTIGVIVLFFRNEHEISFVPDRIIQENTTGSDIYQNQFNEYWYSGLAELSGYDLKQSRYGEIHDGIATMIFVSEPFSKKKQVKIDNPDLAKKDAISVLKLNATRQFLTGIYPYSLMTSVFSPISLGKYSNALKISLTGQEWCGHVFQQMNFTGNKYKFKSFSYFESEGDKSLNINKSILEDEIYNLIRLNPELLPIGKVEIIPSLVVSRFIHKELKPYVSEATIQKLEWNGLQVDCYTIKYLDSNRTLNIYFQPNFPYIIEGWEDTYKGMGEVELTTTAIRKNTKRLDYWNKNNNIDRNLNAELYQ